jgi:hypothetical protein
MSKSDLYKNQKWQVPDDIFARSLTLGDKDLPRGWVKNSVHISHGTKACAIVDGNFVGDIPAGEFTFHDLRDKWLSWKKGDATLLLTRSDVVVLAVDCTGIISADEVPMDIRIDVGVQVDNPAVFVKNLMGPRSVYAVKTLAERLTPAVRQQAWSTTARMRVDDLRGPAIVTKIANQIISAISESFRRYGLKVFSAEGLLIQPSGMEKHWEKVKENNIEIAGEQLVNKRLGQDVGIHQERGDLESKLRDVENSSELKALNAEVTRRSERIPALEKLRDAAIADTFDSAKSAEELKQMLSGVDKQRILRKEEMDQLTEGFDERKEDRESIREHIVSVLDINRGQEIDALRLAVEHSLEIANKKNELEMAEATNSVENLKWRNEIARDFELSEKHREELKKEHAAKWERIRETQRQKQDSSWETLLHQQREETIRTELAYKEAERKRRLELLEAENVAEIERQKIAGERQRREFELEMGNQESDAQFDRLKRVQDMNFEGHSRQVQLDAEIQSQTESRANTHEIDKLKAMGDLSAEALIASSDTDAARALADLKIQEAKSGADIASASSANQQTLNEERLKMYEKLSETEKSKSDAIADVFQQALKGQQTAVEQMISGLSNANNPQTPASPPQMASPPAAPSMAAEWHVVLPGNTQSGPHSFQQIQSLIQQGQVTSETLVWKSSLGQNWLAISQVNEFAGAFPPPAPASPPPPPA